eukprot:CAMPEP_0185259712 /NCGR_PEP_ID=MMETSP1359-20130426/8429_1 /TAXON_ID=552665 /ORGANISM="Bigelowiella longifila, Strain CCMP242" /LENGTH=78 /DNA_ID=CAMNT_0027845703 /DNA_START=537 /DNA_END=773 /DNA_ORIENTATION=+
MDYMKTIVSRILGDQQALLLGRARAVEPRGHDVRNHFVLLPMNEENRARHVLDLDGVRPRLLHHESSSGGEALSGVKD